MKKIKVGAVSYLNTKPFMKGLKAAGLEDRMELMADYPSKVAAALVKGEIDLGLVPVATIPLLNEYHIVGNYGIACDGEVASVALFSRVPLEQVEAVMLDYQSRTSAALVKVLFQHHWKMHPRFIDTQEDFADRIEGTTAGLVIGDRALEQLGNFPYIYDLGTAWKDFTGLSFVFAAWISNKPIPAAFEQAFNDACRSGLAQLDAVAAENPYPVYDLKKYYTENIHFLLDTSKRKGMEKFLEYLRSSS